MLSSKNSIHYKNGVIMIINIMKIVVKIVINYKYSKKYNTHQSLK